MNIKNRFLKKLSISFVAVASMVGFTLTAQAAGGYEKIGKHVESKKKDIDEKTQEEHRKEIIKHVVKIETKENDRNKRRAVEKLLKRLSPSVLELYKEMGGDIHVIDYDITQHENLLGSIPAGENIIDIDGKMVPLNQHYVHAIIGFKRGIFIQQSEDYIDNHQKALNVYYEIGNALAKDALNSYFYSNPELLDVLNSIKNSSNEDGKNMLFSDLLKYQYKDFSRESLLEPDSLKIIQEAFAKAFAYYYEPNHQNSLKIYAESMFNYMDSFNKQEIHIALEEMKHSMNLHNITRSMWDLKNTEKFSSRAIEHIFEGEINSKGQAVGFHTEILTINNTRGSIIPGTEQDFNEYGVYKAKVKINGIPKKENNGFSTFFPKDWYPQRIIDNINEAYNTKIHRSGTINIYDGTGIDGLPIRLYLNNNGEILNAHPIL